MKKVFLILVFLILTSPVLTSSHPGKTDPQGCHTCWENCEKYGLEGGEIHCEEINVAPGLSTSGFFPGSHDHGKKLKKYSWVGEDGRVYTTDDFDQVPREILSDKNWTGIPNFPFFPKTDKEIHVWIGEDNSLHWTDDFGRVPKEVLHVEKPRPVRVARSTPPPPPASVPLPYTPRPPYLPYLTYSIR